MATERTEPAFVAAAPSVEQPRRRGPPGWAGGSRSGACRRNRVALAFGPYFLIVVVLCLAAPIWANSFAHTTPLKNNLTGQVTVDGEKKDVVTPDGVPIGPLAVALLPGSRRQRARHDGPAALRRAQFAVDRCVAALITALFAVVRRDPVGLLPWRRGRGALTHDGRDLGLSGDPAGHRSGHGVRVVGSQPGRREISGDSKLIPILIIAVVYIPYMARPIRGQVFGLREREFVEAARAQGAGPLRIMFSEILPNPLVDDHRLHPLDGGQRDPARGRARVRRGGRASARALVGDDDRGRGEHILTGPHLAIVPGTMLVIAVLALNVFGDGVRDAFDPRATVKLER